MTAIPVFHIGTFTALIIVASAKLEYNVDVVNSLTYKDLVENKAEPLEYTLINPEAKVKLNRITGSAETIDGNKSIKQQQQQQPICNFHIDKTWKSSDPDLDSVEASREFNGCEGRPGIKVLEDSECSIWTSSCCFKRQGSTITVTYCFKRMNIEMMKNPNNTPIMRLTMQFDDPRNKKTLGIEMYPFKKPTDESMSQHANDNSVPIVDSPIPLEVLSKSPLVAGIIGEYGNQHFIGDLLWMKKVLPRAKFESRANGMIKKCTDWYSAGPILIDEEPLNNILELGISLESHSDES